MPGRRMLTYEYILIDGVNASRTDAQKLARLLADQRCKINLIAFNEYPGSPYKTPSPATIAASFSRCCSTVTSPPCCARAKGPTFWPLRTVSGSMTGSEQSGRFFFGIDGVK